ncbi:MAG: SIR2 family protein [Helicobacteraceae bacterium]|jgi:hypothetical protein|nr:SIR2 family protein [Helicobacteraceae bacterium]
MPLADFREGISAGAIAPYLGLEIFKGATDAKGEKLPSSSDEIIFALNSGRPMSERLMLEYPRAAMAIEQRKGRKSLEALFANIYKNGFEPLAIHKKIMAFSPKIVVDTNRDGALQSLFNGDFTLVSGIARVIGNRPRFEAYANNEPIAPEKVTLDKPLLFKPLGILEPQTQLILSDADFVDWITEAMAGMAAPSAFKLRRADLKWLFLGVNFERDTDRMVASEIIGGESSGGGWLVTKKMLSRAEKNFLERHKIEVVSEKLEEFINDAV